MSRTDDGGPAFPRPGYFPDDPEDRLTPQKRGSYDTDPQLGMTLREYLAAKALQGLLAADAGGTEGNYGAIFGDALNRNPHIYARCAVQLADALIAELRK